MEKTYCRSTLTISKQQNYDAHIYKLSEAIWVCVYQPATELHFPIQTGNAGYLRIISWSIIAGDEESGAQYVLILTLREFVEAKIDITIDTLTVVTQFQHVQLNFSNILPFNLAPQLIKATALESFLRAASCENPNIVGSFVRSVSIEIEQLYAQQLLRDIFLLPNTSGRQLMIKGRHPAMAVIGWQDDSKMLLVKKIRFDSDVEAGTNTTLFLDAPAFGGAMLFVDEGIFFFGRILR